MGRLELIWTGSTKVAVRTIRILEPIDVVRDVKDGCLPCGVVALLASLVLEADEDRLDDGFVPAIAPAAHARLQVMSLAEPPPRVTAVLSALI